MAQAAVFVAAKGDDHAAGAITVALAVKGEAAGQEAGIGLEPLVERGGVGFRIDFVHQVVEGVVAGHFEPSASLVAHFEADGGALVFVELCGAPPDVEHVPAARIKRNRPIIPLADRTAMNNKSDLMEQSPKFTLQRVKDPLKKAGVPIGLERLACAAHYIGR
jgi:hypothetical protein